MPSLNDDPRGSHHLHKALEETHAGCEKLEELLAEEGLPPPRTPHKLLGFQNWLESFRRSELGMSDRLSVDSRTSES